VVSRCSELARTALSAVEVVRSEVDVVEFDMAFDVGSYWLFRCQKLWLNQLTLRNEEASHT
jgi:hypothetical protein